MMRVATGPVVMTAMLAIGMPADAAPTLLPCAACAGSLPPARKAFVGPHGPSSRTPLSYDALFGAGHVAAKGLDGRSSAHVFDADGSGFSIETVRRVASRPATVDTIGTRRDKLSAGSVTLRYATDLGTDDSVSFGMSAGMEKRRFALDLARGHHVRSESAGLVATWSHGSAWRLEGGYRADFGSRTASLLERGIELAEGAQRAQRGAWSALSHRIGKADAANSLSFGVRAQAMRLTEADRLSLGAPGHADRRIAFTTSFRFR